MHICALQQFVVEGRGWRLSWPTFTTCFSHKILQSSHENLLAVICILSTITIIIQAKHRAAHRSYLFCLSSSLSSSSYSIIANIIIMKHHHYNRPHPHRQHHHYCSPAVLQPLKYIIIIILTFTIKNRIVHCQFVWRVSQDQSPRCRLPSFFATHTLSHTWDQHHYQHYHHNHHNHQDIYGPSRLSHEMECIDAKMTFVHKNTKVVLLESFT